jgi:hypothetical protein
MKELRQAAAVLSALADEAGIPAETMLGMTVLEFATRLIVARARRDQERELLQGALWDERS